MVGQELQDCRCPPQCVSCDLHWPPDSPKMWTALIPPEHQQHAPHCRDLKESEKNKALDTTDWEISVASTSHKSKKKNNYTKFNYGKPQKLMFSTKFSATYSISATLMTHIVWCP